MARRILVQAGHITPREPGFEGGTGTVREQELTKAMRRRLFALLQRDDRFEPIAAPGDIPDGIRVDAALYLHGDGAASPNASGYSFGFPQHPVNAKLARLIGQEFEKLPGHPPHHTDNYTGGLREYYGYRRVNAPGPEVLVEHGFLTNPREQKWIFKNLGKLATAEYRALCRFYGVPPREWDVVDGPLGFRIVERMDGQAKKIDRKLEPGRIIDRIKSRMAVRKKAVPLQPTGPVEKPKEDPTPDQPG